MYISFSWFPGCQRPTWWCKHKGASYRTIDCDSDGFKDCLCTDTSGKVWTILSSKGCKRDRPRTAQCKALGSSGAPFKNKGCKRPTWWCKHRGARYISMDCDSDGFKDSLCTDTSGKMWTILSSKGCKRDRPKTAKCKALGRSGAPFKNKNTQQFFSFFEHLIWK